VPIAHVRRRVRPIFIPGAGALAKLVGAGAMHIRAVSPTDRRFLLTGEVTRRR
jgi:hypothetical protein